MKRERYACKSCPAFYRHSDKEPISPNGGGWEEKEIDGQTFICCRPTATPWKPDGRRCLIRYGDIYCLVGPRGKKIGTIIDWTGLHPAWCPRLKYRLKEVKGQK